MNATEYPKNEDLICESIVREIASASRWIAVEAAWSALLNVRNMGRQLRDENAFTNQNCKTQSV